MAANYVPHEIGGAAMAPLPHVGYRPADNYQGRPGIHTHYNGRWYMSHLEAEVAEALDRLGITFEYEPVIFRNERYKGGRYTPDFRLPNESIYIETVGKIDNRHRRNAEVFIEEMQCVDLLIDEENDGRPTPSNPAFCFLLGSDKNEMTENGELVDAYGNMLLLLKCHQCNSWSIVRYDGGWNCMHCGAYIGDGSKTGDNHGSNLIVAGAIAHALY